MNFVNPYIFLVYSPFPQLFKVLISFVTMSSEWRLVEADFPELPQLPFYCPYVDPDTKEPEFKTRKEYTTFCRKNYIKILSDQQLKEIGEKYRLDQAEEQKRRDAFFCPYDNLEGKRGDDGKLLPRFKTREEYEAHCVEWASITGSKIKILTNQQLKDLAKKWAEEKEVARLQAGCRNYLDWLEQQWWETC